MKTRKVKFKAKGQVHEYSLATFESLKEAQGLLGTELLNVINLGNAVYAKAMAMGKNPFKPRRTRYRIDATKLDSETLQKLKDSGAIL
jgi:hypothetical protein